MAGVFVTPEITTVCRIHMYALTSDCSISFFIGIIYLSYYFATLRLLLLQLLSDLRKVSMLFYN